MTEPIEAAAKALDLYRYYIDATDAELTERGLSREAVLAQARLIDPYDGETPTAEALRRPAASGDLRERIARIVGGDIFGMPDNSAGPATLAARKNALAKADAIIASLPGRNDEAIRAQERERCAVIAENHSFARDIEWWLTSTKKEVSAESCHSVAAAIRSGAALAQQGGRE